MQEYHPPARAQAAAELQPEPIRAFLADGTEVPFPQVIAPAIRHGTRQSRKAAAERAVAEAMSIGFQLGARSDGSLAIVYPERCPHELLVRLSATIVIHRIEVVDIVLANARVPS